MKKIHNLLIVDASGSMSSKVEEVRGGINQIFRDLKDEDKKQKGIKNRITVVDFSSHGDYNILYDNVKPKDLKVLKEGEYKPRSMTALYDAIGKAFDSIKAKADGVLVTIFTDGMENDSKQFKADTIKKLIKQKDKEGWTITFMGTSKEAMLQAQSIGIQGDKMLRYSDSKEGTVQAFHRFRNARIKYSQAIENEITVSNIFDKERVDDTSVE